MYWIINFSQTFYSPFENNSVVLAQNFLVRILKNDRMQTKFCKFGFVFGSDVLYNPLLHINSAHN